MKQTNTLIGIMALLVVIAIGASDVALANTASKFEEISTTVNYADLNLQNEAGIQVLYGRLKSAASERIVGNHVILNIDVTTPFEEHKSELPKQAKVFTGPLRTD